MSIKDFCIVCSLFGFLFLKGSFNLIYFDRNWFLINIDFFKPGVVQGLSLNFILFLEIFLRGAKVSSKNSNVFSVHVRWKQKIIAIKWETIQYKFFLIKSWLISFIVIWFRVRGIKNDIRSYNKLWKMVKLPEIILGTAMLEKMLSINVLELVLTLLGCRI